MTDAEMIEELRAYVDVHYREAVADIETLQATLLGLPRNEMEPCRNGTFRASVLQVLTNDWQTIAAIADASGVDTARVRGVLYAKPLVGVSFESGHVDGRAAFRQIRLTTPKT